MTIIDDDIPGITVEPTEISVREGATATYTVVMDTRPSNSTGRVIITINDPANSDVTAEPASWTFTNSNWNVPRTVTVSAAHDDNSVAEPDVSITHTISPNSDWKYRDLTVDSVTVTITDDDDAPSGSR